MQGMRDLNTCTFTPVYNGIRLLFSKQITASEEKKSKKHILFDVFIKERCHFQASKANNLEITKD